MKRFARLLIVTLGFGVLGFVLSLVPQKSATGTGSAPVTVMNTAANPLPVSLQGTGTISGSVSATQNGMWNVGITGIPSVSVTNTPSVSIAGTPGINLDCLSTPTSKCSPEGGLPIAATLCAGVGTSAGFCGGIPSTAAVLNDGIIIESVSGYCSASGGTGPLPATIDWVDLNVSTNNTPAKHFIAFPNPELQAPPGITSYAAFTQMIKIYANTPSTNIVLEVQSFSDPVLQGALCEATLSGRTI